MSVTEISIDPIAILQMSSYFEKRSRMTSPANAIFGFLYAKQIQLKFNISLTTPLGTDQDSVEELIKRADTFETIRKTKSKTAESYYLQYDLVGVYMMKKARFTDSDKQLQKLSADYSKKGAPFSLVVLVDSEIETKFYKDNNPYPFTNEMHTNEKICVDSLQNQNSKSLVGNTIKKQTNMISHFNGKIKTIIQKLENKKFDEYELIELAELLDNYDRIKFNNEPNKIKTIEAMNYSILVGLSVGRIIKQ